jgi:hypothetical protein
MQQLVFLYFKGLTKNGFRIQMTFAQYVISDVQLEISKII